MVNQSITLYILWSLLLPCTPATSSPRICGQTMGTDISDVRVSVDCSEMSLEHIPQDLPIGAEVLDFSHNNISMLPEDGFRQMNNLKWLSFHGNRIRYISSNSLSGLYNLTYLDLRYNPICYNSLPKDLFQDLHSLTSLYMNHMDCTPSHILYPDHLLADLPNLETLYLDGISNASLGPGFKELSSLATLVFAGKGCHMGYISDRTFEILQNIPMESLYIRHCEVQFMEPTSLRWLTSLSTLVLQGFHIGLNIAAQVLNSIPSPYMDTVVLDSVCPPMSLNSLTVKDFCLNTTKRVKRLSLRANRIISVDLEIFKCFPELDSFNIGYNSPLTTTNPSPHQTTDGDIRKYIGQLYSLRLMSLDVSNMFKSISHYLTHWSSTDDHVDTFFRRPPDFIHIPDNITMTRHNIEYPQPKKEFLNIRYNIPPTLFYIYCDSFHVPLEMRKPSDIDPHNNILFLNMSRTIAPHMGKVTGLKHLQGVDFSHCQLTGIDDETFKDTPSLVYLNLRANRLGLLGHNLKLTFQFLGQLEILDLSHNDITSLDPDTFASLYKLQKLDLSWNKLQSVDFHMRALSQLRILDFSYNLLDQLPRNLLTELQSPQKNSSLVIRLPGNAFVCDCKAIDRWIEPWMANGSQFVDLGKYTCQMKDMRVLRLIEGDIHLLKEECPSLTRNLIAICSGLIAMVVTFFIGVGIMWRFKWTLKKQLYLIRRKLHLWRNRHSDALIGVQSTMWDAFVAHNHEYERDWVTDYLLPMAEEMWHLNLCVGYRDFIAGAPIAENIVQAISHSRKVVLLVTEAFSQSGWCEFEMQMALTMKGLKNVIICRMDEQPMKGMSVTLQKLLQRASYIQWTNVPAGEELFWQRLKYALEEKDEESSNISWGYPDYQTELYNIEEI